MSISASSENNDSVPRRRGDIKILVRIVMGRNSDYFRNVFKLHLHNIKAITEHP